MSLKSIVVNLRKWLLSSIVFAAGLIVGGMVVTMLGLQQPPMPAGLDGQSARRFLLLQSPLLVLVLALLARHLSGGFSESLLWPICCRGLGLAAGSRGASLHAAILLLWAAGHPVYSFIL